MRKPNKPIISIFFATLFLFYALLAHGSEQNKNQASDLNTKKKTIYIHIGTPKTGTTSIQTFLTKNADILLEEDMFFPAAGICYSKKRGVSIGHILKNKDKKDFLFCVNGHVLNNEVLLREVLEAFAKSKKSKMLLSDESLIFMPIFLQTRTSFLNTAHSTLKCNFLRPLKPKKNFSRCSIS